MTIKKHLQKDPCCCNHNFNHRCDKDEGAEEKARAVNEAIKKRMLEIAEERKIRGPDRPL